MATLNVTNLQNVASTVTNVSLLADGTTTLVLNATGTARTGGIRYNAGTLEVYTGTAWVAAGGGGGSVTGVTATLPLASTGGAAPDLSIGIGLGTAVNGSNIAVSIPVAATPPAAGTGAAQAMNGSLYWDSNLGALFLRYFDGTTTQWVQAAASGNVTAATAAQAAAGALTSVYLSPATGVPKDASGMTGAAILPSGTNAQRTAITSPVAGMTRFNTDYTPDSLEVYDGANWKQIAYVPSATPLPADLTISANTTLTSSTYVVNNLTINSGVTVTLGSQSVVFYCYGDVNIAGTIDANGVGPTGAQSFVGTFGTYSPIFLGSNIGASFDSSTPAPVYSPSASILGSGGSSGPIIISAGGAAGSYGGAGGGSIIIRSLKDVTITGTLSAKGSNGSSLLLGPPASAGGGGGGSGGSVIVHASGNINFSGTINVAGGNGGNGVNSGVTVGFNGGGGGGGGYVILQTSNTLTNTGTLVLTGGSAGASTGTVDVNVGGPGSSFGGKGGAGRGGPGAVAGSSGIFSTVGSPI